MEIVGATLLATVAVAFWLNQKQQRPTIGLSHWEVDEAGAWRIQPVLNVGKVEERYESPGQYAERLHRLLGSQLRPDQWETIWNLERAELRRTGHSDAVDPREVPWPTGDSFGAEAFSPELNDRGEVAFANLLAAIQQDSPQGYRHWRQACRAQTSGARRYASQTIEALHAIAVVCHAKLARDVKPFRLLPPEIYRELLDALHFLEAFLHRDTAPVVELQRFAPLIRIVYPLDELDPVLVRMREGQETRADHQAFLRIIETERIPFVVWMLREWMLYGDESEGARHLVVPWHFAAASLASLLAKERGVLPDEIVQRMEALLLRCAAQVPPDALEFGEIASLFDDCGFQLPEYAPLPQGGHAITVDGSGAIAVRPLLRSLRGHATERQAGDETSAPGA